MRINKRNISIVCAMLLIVSASIVFYTELLGITFGSISFLHTANAAGETWSEEVDVKGKSSAILVNNVNNSGIMDFDYDLGTYEARLTRVAETPFLEGETVYRMEGWAWNDNLGWVSFYCDGVDHDAGTAGIQGQNLGASCGNQTYGVTLIYHTATAEDPAYFSFTGYAWNDATGYISMNSTNGGSVKYGLRLDENGIVTSDYPTVTASPYAWSQSITWINFAGVTADIEILVVPEPTCGETDFVGVCPDVCIEVSGVDLCNEDKLGGLDVYTVPSFPIADGVDSYKIKLQFKDGEGNSISKVALANYDVRIFFEWEDTVKRNQVNGGKADSNLKYLKEPFKSTTYNGSITYKPVFLYINNTSVADFIGMPVFNTNNSTNISATTSGNAEWSSDGKTLTLYVKSLAPTSDGNKSKIVSLGDTAYVRNDIGIDGEMNNLKLKSISWILEDSADHEIKGRTPYNKGTNQYLDLDFKPALEVDTLNTVSTLPEYKDTLVLYRNVETKLEVKPKEWEEGRFIRSYGDIKFKRTSLIGNSNISLTTQVLLDDGRKALIDGEMLDWTILAFNHPETDSIAWNPSQLFITAGLTGKMEDYTNGVKIESQISYTPQPPYAKDVTYYSNHLPRTEANIANPVAVIQGSLYGTGTTTQTGIELTGIGDNNTNIVKDTVYENVKKLVRGKEIQSTTATIDSNFTCGECESIGPLNGLEEILYVKGDATISSNTTWNGYKVLVVDGGNLYIDGNIYNSDDTKATANKLGLVVIRNTNDSLSKAGNIYVSKDVTNIQAFAVVWGAIFSYDGIDKTDQGGNGEFLWDNDETKMIDALNKQLIWQGGISSNNTIGGVDIGEDYYKTGYQILPKDDDNLFIARLYDLNYFRYFRKKMHYDEETEQATDVNKDGYVNVDDMVIDEENKAQGALDTETNPLYVKYVPPYSKSLIFGKEKSLTF